LALIRVNNIFKYYSGHCALKDLSLSIPSQSVFGLLGPNGAGKTSFIRILTQIIAPDKGQVFINGKLLAPEHIYQTGYLPEERGLYKNMKVEEHLIYLARLKGMIGSDAKKKASLWLEKLSLLQWKDRKVEELSKGMQQKVQFIASVIHDPLIIILDEPFTGFDPLNAEIIKKEILKLKRNGATVILSTHRMESVEELCDEVLLLNKGEKVLEGKLSEIREEFKSNVYLVECSGPLQTTEDYLLLNIKFEQDRKIFRIKLKKELSNNELLKKIMMETEVISFREELPGISDIFIKKIGVN
jgi:ABC-2 type transport system ATP-binding protein